MIQTKMKLPNKDVVKNLRRHYEEQRKKSKASPSLIEGLKDPAIKAQEKLKFSK